MSEGTTVTATVLPFVTRAVYDETRFDRRVSGDTNPSPLTPEELYLQLVQVTLQDSSNLIRKLKSTGQWNPHAEQHMRQAMNGLMSVCAAVAGVKQYGKTRQTTQESTTGIATGVATTVSDSSRTAPIAPIVTFSRPLAFPPAGSGRTAGPDFDGVSGDSPYPK